MDKVLDSAILSSANKRKGILAIGAHPDDIELGCGASLARLAQKGIYIAAVVMTTGNSGTDGIIDRHEESRNALKILGCHQTIHLNFADTRAHLQLNDMISALEDIIKNQIPSDVEIMRVYTMHDADRPLIPPTRTLFGSFKAVFLFCCKLYCRCSVIRLLDHLLQSV